MDTARVGIGSALLISASALALSGVPSPARANAAAAEPALATGALPLATQSTPPELLAADGSTVVSTGDLAALASTATSGQTIRLTSDVAVSSPIVLSASVTLDGAGHTISASGAWPQTERDEGGEVVGTPANEYLIRVVSASAGPKASVKNVTLDAGSLTYEANQYVAALGVLGGSVTLDHVSVMGAPVRGAVVQDGSLSVGDACSVLGGESIVIRADGNPSHVEVTGSGTSLGHVILASSSAGHPATLTLAKTATGTTVGKVTVARAAEGSQVTVGEGAVGTLSADNARGTKVSISGGSVDNLTSGGVGSSSAVSGGIVGSPTLPNNLKGHVTGGSFTRAELGDVRAALDPTLKAWIDPVTYEAKVGETVPAGALEERPGDYTPGTPNVPDTPSSPDAAATPQSPDTPGSPASPETPAAPTTPDTAAAADTPGTAGTPQAAADPLSPPDPSEPSTPSQSAHWEWNAGAWRYRNAEGVFATGWVWDGSDWYYLAHDGGMRYGWLYDGGWYYLNERSDGRQGAMEYGWVDWGGHWYWLNPDGNAGLRGEMRQSSWVLDRGTWYHVGADGSMDTGWLWDGTWYFLDGSGAMRTGWVWDGAWYYLNADGSILYDAWTPDGYRVGADGTIR